jgi:hypothetical protein
MIETDVVEEALRIHRAASQRELELRVTGGVAVRLHSTASLPPSLTRVPQDIDVVVPKGSGRPTGELLTALGYEPNERFNMMNSGRRALFYDTVNDRQLDVFVGEFQMCHAIPITARIDVEPLTVPLAELLLTKLQIVELNEKDQRDIFALVHEHTIGDGDADTINGDAIAALCAADWGLWRTVTLNLARSRVQLDDGLLPSSARELIGVRLAALEARIDVEPKGRRFMLRARVGDRKRWYLEPDEVG